MSIMKIQFFCPYWGSETLDFKTFLDKVRKAGYDGVEMSLPIESESREDISGLLQLSGMKFIAQHWETSTADFREHKVEFQRRLVNLVKANPLFINTQTGKDFFSFQQNAELIEIADKISQTYGVKIIHETHRGKFSFAPHITFGYLTSFPGLRLGLDISHWCNVAESWLDDQSEAINMAISRADHIHARVGFPEGPQIPDPRAPEWQGALEKHLKWWKQVIDQRSDEGWSQFTITPEFGPYPYMTILPHSRLPLANQWEVNVFMMDYLKSKLS